MKTKLEMAHEYLLRFSGTTVADAWAYADAMQAEANKREPSGFPNVLRGACGEIVAVKVDDKEWQPDWSQAPDWANWWAVDKNGQGIWYNLEPRRDQSTVEWVIDFSSGSDFSYKISPDFNYQGDWRESLRKRPK